MKIWKVLTISLLILILNQPWLPAVSDEAPISQTQVAVAKGDLTVKVNGTGKDGLFHDARTMLSVPAGKIETTPC